MKIIDDEYLLRELNNSKTQSVINDMLLSNLADEDDQNEQQNSMQFSKFQWNHDKSFFRNSDTVRLIDNSLYEN